MFKNSQNKKISKIFVLFITAIYIIGFFIPSQTVSASAGSIKFAKATLNGVTTELKISANAEDNTNVPATGAVFTLLFSTDGSADGSALKNISSATVNKSNGSTNGSLCVLTKAGGALTDETVSVADVTPAEYGKTCLNVTFSNLKEATEYALTIKSGITTNNGSDWTDADTVIAFTTTGTSSSGNGGNNGVNNGTPVELSSSDPTDGQKNVAANAVLNLVFSKNVVNMTVKDNNLKCFSLETSKGDVVPIKVVMADDQMEPDKKNNVSIVPQSELTAGTSYILKISPDLKSKSGDTLSKDIQLRFTVAGGGLNSTAIIIASIIVAAVIITALAIVLKKRNK